MGYTATTVGMALSPAGIVTMVEIPIIGYLLTKGADPRKMVFLGLVVVGGSLYWMSTLNLQVAEMNLIVPRIVQVLGVAVITVPISTIVFRFLPKDQTSNAAGIYAVMRNEGGSIGIAASSTMLQRGAQTHQNILVAHATAPVISAYLGHPSNATSSAADMSQVGLARLYALVQQQAALLSYMDQFRMLAGITLCLLPLVFFLKRAPKGGKVEVGHME
jgi:DHA2 family multidrug resistance protein